jgi:hypothetical protein
MASTPSPAVTTKAPIQSRTPLSTGATQSARQWFGRPGGFSNCCRSIRRRARSTRRSSLAQSTTSSSPTRLAGKKAMAARGWRSFSSTIRRRSCCASSKRERAWGPTTASSRMAGYFPASSHDWKKGVQSMVWVSSSKSYSSKTLTPVKAGSGGV